jgi:hypothetical protein
LNRERRRNKDRKESIRLYRVRRIVERSYREREREYRLNRDRVIVKEKRE